MAIPTNTESIETNLPAEQLRVFLDALEAEKCEHVAGSTSLFEFSAGCEFNFNGATYSITEFCEVVNSVHLVSGKPAFIQSLIDNFESQLSEMVEKRDFDTANKINEKIMDLQSLLIAKQPIL